MDEPEQRETESADEIIKSVETIPSSQNFKLGTAEYVGIMLAIVLLLVFMYNVGRISNIQPTAIIGNVVQDSSSISSNSILPSVSASEIIPTGVPEIYGSELGVNFDEVSESNPQGANANIKKLSDLDKSITLEGDNLQRYINSAGKISCEYCCGAKAIIRSDGSAACGCAHSYAMRGLAKYLITEHGSEYTDDEILEELGKWKVLFFPGKHETKAAVLKAQGIKINYINLASNAYRGIEQGISSGGGMVGGC